MCRRIVYLRIHTTIRKECKTESNAKANNISRRKHIQCLTKLHHYLQGNVIPFNKNVTQFTYQAK